MVVSIIGVSGSSEVDSEVSVGIKVLVRVLVDHCFILFEGLGGSVIVEQYAKRR